MELESLSVFRLLNCREVLTKNKTENLAIVWQYFSAEDIHTPLVRKNILVLHTLNLFLVHSKS